MCGRFTLRTPPTEIASLFSVQLAIEFKKNAWLPRYNIAPSQNVSVIVFDPEQERRWTLFRWGLIPSWAKDTKIGYKLINARGETIAEKPSFRNALKKRRCLVLADGFYEWQKTESGKQPYHFHREDGGVMAFAGLWEKWNGDDTIYSCTIITTQANELLGRFHDRMPVILDAEDHEQWLDPDFQDKASLQNLIRPYPAEEMSCQMANRIVNNVKNESPECLVPGDEKRPGELF